MSDEPKLIPIIRPLLGEEEAAARLLDEIRSRLSV